MKTKKQVLETYKSKCFDQRDVIRLLKFLSREESKVFGFELKPEVKHRQILFTRRNILRELKSDLEFAFEKALDKRAISSGKMFDVIMMWNWILEEGLEDFPEDNYAEYGLPLFKATALKYGFNNPIGDDVGDENKYSSEGWGEQD